MEVRLLWHSFLQLQAVVLGNSNTLGLPLAVLFSDHGSRLSINLVVMLVIGSFRWLCWATATQWACRWRCYSGITAPRRSPSATAWRTSRTRRAAARQRRPSAQPRTPACQTLAQVQTLCGCCAAVMAQRACTLLLFSQLAAGGTAAGGTVWAWCRLRVRRRLGHIS